jgi:hypothetical protein
MTKLEREHVCDGCRWRSHPIGIKAPARCQSLHRDGHYAKRCENVESCLVWEAKE